MCHTTLVSSFLFLSILSSICLLSCSSFLADLFLFSLLWLLFSLSLSLPWTIFPGNLTLCCHIDGEIVVTLPELSFEADLLMSASLGSCVRYSLRLLGDGAFSSSFHIPGLLSTFWRLSINHESLLQEEVLRWALLPSSLLYSCHFGE